MTETQRGRGTNWLDPPATAKGQLLAAASLSPWPDKPTTPLPSHYRTSASQVGNFYRGDQVTPALPVTRLPTTAMWLEDLSTRDNSNYVAPGRPIAPALPVVAEAPVYTPGPLPAFAKTCRGSGANITRGPSVHYRGK